MDFATVLPGTAIVAIALFATKETLEYRRRLQGDARKIKALKQLLVRDCELNHWTIKQLESAFDRIKNDLSQFPQKTHRIDTRTGGKAYMTTEDDVGNVEMEMWIPDVHRDAMSKNLLEIATLDPVLFALVQEVFDALAEIQHVRHYLLDLENEKGGRFIDPKDFKAGLVDYALDELSEAKKDLKLIYKHCTGLEMTTHRLR